MTIQEILAGESKNLELKKARPDKSIKYMKSVVAFANGKGGRIVFGVDDDRNVVGSAGKGSSDALKSQQGAVFQAQ